MPPRPAGCNERLHTFLQRHLEARGAPGCKVEHSPIHNDACDLGWIYPGTCGNMQRKLDNAARALERRQPGAARVELSALLTELDSQRGRHVTENAYWLLRSNVAEIFSTL